MGRLLPDSWRSDITESQLHLRKQMTEMDALALSPRKQCTYDFSSVRVLPDTCIGLCVQLAVSPAITAEGKLAVTDQGMSRREVGNKPTGE